MADASNFGYPMLFRRPSDFDNLELKFCTSSSYTFYFTCAKNQTNLRGSGGDHWLKWHGMTLFKAKLTVNTADKFLQWADSLLNSWLCKRVVILNAVEQLWEAPETVGFKLLPTWFSHISHIAQWNIWTYRYSQQHVCVIKDLSIYVSSVNLYEETMF